MSPQIIEIILFAAVAAFLVFRLKNVLGTRTGHEDPPNSTPSRWPGQDDRSLDREAEVVAPAQSPPPTDASPSPQDEITMDATERELNESARTALHAMRRLEPSFGVTAFLQGAKQAYEWIIIDFENGEKDRLRQMLSPTTFAEFEKVIDDRQRQELTVEARFVGFRSAEVKSIMFDAATKRARVEVQFIADLITAVRNPQGEVVEGDPRTIRQQRDLWVFERNVGSEDPNWILTETS